MRLVTQLKEHTDALKTFLEGKGFEVKLDPKSTWQCTVLLYDPSKDLYVIIVVDVYYGKKKGITVLTGRIKNDKQLALWKALYKEFSSIGFSDINAYPEGGVIEAYVDGSFINGTIGYGSVILQDQKILHVISGKMDKQYNAHRQVGGELKAVIETINWCKHRQVKEVSLFYDYEGIEKWATGAWHAKKEMTQLYQCYMQRQSLKVHFHKVAAHSGNKWNDKADQLARAGSLS